MSAAVPHPSEHARRDALRRIITADPDIGVAAAEALYDLEWAGQTEGEDFGDLDRCCPWCESEPHLGHAPGCALGSVIGALNALLAHEIEVAS